MLKPLGRFETSCRDEIIDLVTSFAAAARRLYEADPSRTVFVRIDGDPGSGKSLITDTARAKLFDETEVPLAKTRLIAHYRGKIGNDEATISLVNLMGCPLDIVFGHAGMISRKREPGFVFFQRCSSYSPTVPSSYHDPDFVFKVSYPDKDRQSWRFRAFQALELDCHKPTTPNRVIEVFARDGLEDSTLE